MKVKSAARATICWPGEWAWEWVMGMDNPLCTLKQCVRVYGQHLFNCQLSVECAEETNTLPAVR